MAYDKSDGTGASTSRQQPLFTDLAADEKDLGVTEIESLCMVCERNGTTRLLLTKIPMFKEVIVSSFSCPHCGASDSSIQPGAAVEDRGVRYTFRVQEREHLNRLVVQADTASVQIPELEFEIPPHTQKGSITTVESILMQSVEGLEKEQPVRKFCSVVVSVDGKEGTVIRLATSDMLKGTITAVLNAIFQTVSIEL